MSLRLIPTTVTKLFEGKKKQFVIPVYQRAYSWEEPQLRMLLDDLLDQNLEGNPYSLGSILVEEADKYDTYEVIDGQQRLTTVIVFMRALINVLNAKNWLVADDVGPADIEEDFLKKGHNVKLKTVAYDNEYFNFVIMNNSFGGEPKTRSQHRIIKAKEYFEQELEEMSLSELQHLYAVLTSAEVNWLISEGNKTESALLFELQNNRGVQLTTLEKIKSFFMYQIYQKCDINDTPSVVESVAENFNSIYKTASTISRLNEEEIFSIVSNFLTREYRTITIDTIMEKTKDSEDAIEYIKSYSARLSQAFKYVQLIESIQDNPKLEVMRKYNFNEAYPFLMWAKEYKVNEDEFAKTINVLEVVMFYVRLINTRADFRTRLQRVLNDYKGEESSELAKRFAIELVYYWSPIDVKNQLKGNMLQNKMFYYIAMEYENSLSSTSYNSSEIEISRREQEHIAPQNPKYFDHRGYEFDGNSYSDRFLENGLNSIGNLTVLPKVDNSSISNKNFDEKLEYFDNSILLQHKEIREFASEVDGELMWDMDAVNRRAEKIIDFVEVNWNIESLF